MKSQMSIEFLIGVTIILIIYVATIGVFSNYTQTNVVESEMGKQVCYTLSTGVSSAVIGGDNIALNITLPEKISNKNYHVYVVPGNESTITIDWGDGISSCTLTTQNVTKLNFTPCKLSINNLNGTVYISTLSTENETYPIGNDVLIVGKYFLTNVSLSISKNNSIIINETLPTSNGEFNYTFHTTSTGTYLIKAYDENYKTLNSEKTIYVI